MTTRDRRATPVLSDGGGPPAVAHVPGSGTAPDRARLARLARIVRAADVAPGARATPRALADGCALYDAGYFWEAHEIWEPLWMDCQPNGRERRLVEGVIALANACLKLRMDRPHAAARLLARARALLDARLANAGPILGVDFAGLPPGLDRFAPCVDGGSASAEAALEARPELSVYLNQ